MPTQEEQELQRTLEEILEKTREGDLVWSRMNPTTFIWIKKWGRSPQEGAKVTIQKVSKRMTVKDERERLVVRAIEHYIFQVNEVQTNAQMVTLSTEDNPEFAEILSAIFAVASTNISRRGLGFLRKALDEKGLG